MDESCVEAARLADDIFMKVLVAFKVLVCGSGPILLFWNIRSVGTDWLIHPNATFIYRAHLIYTLLVSVFFFFVYSYDFVRLIQTNIDPCAYRIPVGVAVLVRTLSVICVYGQITTMLALAIERFIASIKPREYEKVKNNLLAKVLVPLGTAFSILFCGSMVLPGVHWDEYSVGFVIRTPENASGYQTVVWLEMVPEVLSLCLFHLVKLLSSPLRVAFAHQVDLNARYQMEENRKVCQYLLPVFYTHFVIFFLTAFGITLFPLLFPNGRASQFAVFLEVMVWSPLYACVMPIIVHFRSQYRAKESAKVDPDLWVIIALCVLVCFALRHANDFYYGDTVTLVDEGLWLNRFRHDETHHFLSHVERDFTDMYEKLRDKEEERVKRQMFGSIATIEAIRPSDQMAYEPLYDEDYD